MDKDEIKAMVGLAANLENVEIKVREGTQIKANALWEGSCSPTKPQRKVGVFLAADGRSDIAIEGAHRRMTMALTFPEAAIIVSKPDSENRSIKLVGYSDSRRLKQLAEAFGVSPDLVPRPVFTIAAQPDPPLDQESQVDIEELNRLKASLHEIPNVVLQGPPGTGKSSVALTLVKTLASTAGISAEDCRFGRLIDVQGFDLQKLVDDEKVIDLPVIWEMIQMHPSYAYDDLVRRIVPVNSPDGHLRLEVQDGLFLQLCKLAEKRGPDKPVLLIMDEINRCNLAAVLGEFLLAIDSGHRGVPVRLQVQAPGLVSSVAVPSNLWIVGTMNTADRSIALVDYAVRRRFRFIDMRSSRAAVQKWYADNPVRAELVASLFDSCNSGLHHRLRIGPSPFLVKKTSSQDWPDRLARRIAYEVFPLLHEYGKEGLRDKSPVSIGSESLPISDQQAAAQKISMFIRNRLAAMDKTSFPGGESVVA